MINTLTSHADKPWKLKLWHVATQGFEDVTGLPVIEKKRGAAPVAKFAKADHIPGAVHDPDNYTLGVFDELTTAPPLIQNQIREMIDGQLNGEPVDPNCLYIGTGNPPDAKFITVQAMDDALEKRLKVYAIVPTNEELLAVWSTMMPEKIYKFIALNGQYIDAVSPREWEGISKDVQDTLDGGGSIDDAIAEAAADLYDTPEVITKLREYFQFGDDPYHYPILGRTIVSASAADMTMHLKLVKKWLKDGITGRVGASAHDLVRVITMLPSNEYANPQQTAENIVQLASLLIDNKCIDLGKAILETAVKSVLKDAVGAVFKGTDQFDKLAEMVYGINKLKAAVGAADAGRS